MYVSEGTLCTCGYILHNTEILFYPNEIIYAPSLQATYWFLRRLVERKGTQHVLSIWLQLFINFMKKSYLTVLKIRHIDWHIVITVGIGIDLKFECHFVKFMWKTKAFYWHGKQSPAYIFNKVKVHNKCCKWKKL